MRSIPRQCLEGGYQIGQLVHDPSLSDSFERPFRDMRLSTFITISAFSKSLIAAPAQDCPMLAYYDSLCLISMFWHIWIRGCSFCIVSTLRRSHSRRFPDGQSLELDCIENIHRFHPQGQTRGVVPPGAASPMEACEYHNLPWTNLNNLRSKDFDQGVISLENIARINIDDMIVQSDLYLGLPYCS
jgi:hypothetical protein